MRILRVVIVVMVLIVFPLVSWLYLSSGLKWRLTAQDETAVKGELGPVTFMHPDSSTVTRDDLFNKTFYVVAHPESDQATAHLEEVHEQFAVRKDYKTLFILDAGSAPVKEDDAHWLNLYCDTRCQSLMSSVLSEGASAAILDDSLRIRGRYKLADEEELRALIRHLAVVLPIDKREKLELKRGGKE